MAAPADPGFSRIIAGVWRMADWQLTAPGRLRWIESCLDLGITSFDHADIYGDHRVETLFGQALALAPGLRARMQIVSKCGIRLPSAQRPANRLKSYDTSAAHVEASVNESLRALGTDHLDVLLIHRPDALMDAAALAQCFERLRAAGKVRHFGASNFTPSQFDLLNRCVPLVTNQIELSPLHLDPLFDGTLDQAQALGRPPMIWSPLAGGRLFSGTDAAAVRVRDTLQRIARDGAISVATLAYAWLLRHPARPLPLTGSQRLENLQHAVAALHLTLDSQTWYEIWTAGAGHEVP